jgi:hypothetical protein
MTTDVMLEWALHYAELGWPVLPLHVPVQFGPKHAEGTTTAATCSCGDTTCSSQGKHPRTTSGLDDATTDAATVTGWWERWPMANIGLRTGVVFDVLDLDGMTALDMLDLCAPEGAGTIAGPWVATGNGVHHYVQTLGQGNRAGMGAKGSGIDWRGTGGYVVAPPSLHMSGAMYEWVAGHESTTPLASAPDWLRHLVEQKRPAPDTKAALARRALQLDRMPQTSRAQLRTTTHGTTPYGQAVLERATGAISMAGEGGRNHALNTSALHVGHYVAGGEIDHSDAERALLDAATRAGLGEKESTATIRSGMNAGMAEPKSAPQGVKA